MNTTEFNLLREPWIRVRLNDFTVSEVSLTDVLLHAHEYRDLAGEMPTQDAAMLRLLLAVLHTVFSRVDANGEPAPLEKTSIALQRWGELWKLGHFPEQPIRDYLEQWQDRFWLFHPERPFWQVPEAKIGTSYKAAKLNGEISESDSKLRLFSTYAGDGKTELSYAQAARWLLALNGFDDKSLKAKGKGLPSAEFGWIGNLGYIQAKSTVNLFETLMLNLTFLKDGERLWGEDHPCWELEIPRSAERTEIAQPDNPAELLTMQSRRLLLIREGNKIKRFTSLGGDFFSVENAFSEQMTVWCDSDAKKSKKTGIRTFEPAKHDKSRQFWRELPAVFCDEGENCRKPGVVNWIQALQNYEILNRHRMIGFKICGVTYDENKSMTTDVFSDSLCFNAGLLESMKIKWRREITEQIGKCEQAAKIVGHLAQNLSIAAGDKNDTCTASAQTQFYFMIDQPFRQWLQSIDPDEDELLEKAAEWEKQARQLAIQLGEQMVEQTGNAAFTGHWIKNEKTEKKYLYTAPKAYNDFLWELSRVYPKENKEG